MVVELPVTNSYDRQKGPEYERKNLPLFQVYYPGAYCPGKQGRYDKGDYVLPGETRFIVEAKWQTRVDLPGWMGEAEREARNAGVPFGVVLHKRVGKTDPALQWVTLKLGDFLRLVNGAGCGG